MQRSKLTFALGSVLGVTALWAGAAIAGGGRVSLTDIEAALSALSQNQYVPYKVEISGGLCDTVGGTASNPEIAIESDGSDGTFTVSAINMRTSGIQFDETGLVSLVKLTVDGTFYDFLTGPLVVSSEAGSSLRESVNLLGAYVGKAFGTNPTDDADVSAGRVPHELVANSAGSNDIVVRMFCRADVRTLNIDSVSVTGWKRAGDNITVTYTP